MKQSPTSANKSIALESDPADSHDNTKNPVLTVVMPVFNGEEYLREAMDSVLAQTFSDFEFIVINDGSTDKSAEVIQSFKDDRIRYIDNGVNRGIPYSRNEGLSQAKGEFLAWCDCDDVLHPTKFAKQIAFLRDHTEYGACGTLLKGFGRGSKEVFKASKNPEIIKSTLLFRPSIPNPTVMHRMSKIRELNLKYDTDLPISEDYDFILRCSMHFPMTNIQKILYRHRASETSIMRQYKSQEAENYRIHKIVYRRALAYLGITPKESELKTHWLIASTKLLDNFSALKICYDWLINIKSINEEKKVYESKAFNKVLAHQFYFVCKKASRFGFSTLRFYLTNSLSSFGLVGLIDIFKLMFRCAIRYNKF